MGSNFSKIFPESHCPMVLWMLVFGEVKLAGFLCFYIWLIAIHHFGCCK